MIIDCDRCAVRGDACRDCVVGVFLGVPGVPGDSENDTDDPRPPGVPSGARSVQLDAPECRALGVLADHGLVPRLRLVVTDPRDTSLRMPTDDGYSDVG